MPSGILGKSFITHVSPTPEYEEKEEKSELSLVLYTPESYSGK